MDKVFSARVDETVIQQISILAQQLGKTKKAIIENAIQMFAEKMKNEHDFDVFEQTLGAWCREETPEETRENARKEFRRSMLRYQK